MTQGPVVPAGGSVASWLALAISTGVMVSGCLGAPGPPATDSDASNSASRSLFDPWDPGEMGRVLFDETIAAETCPPGLPPGVADGVGVHRDVCINRGLPSGTRIPLGTGIWRVDVDATDALKAGGYAAFLFTRIRDDPNETDTAPTTEAVHTFEVPLSPGDWDLPDVETSDAAFGLFAQGDGPTVFRGNVHLTVTTVRNPDWAGGPVEPSHVRLLEANGTWEIPPTALGERPSGLPFSHAVPQNVSIITSFVTWTVTSCAPDHRCSPTPNLERGTEADPGKPISEGSAWRIRGFGRLVSPDQAGDTALVPFAARCVQPEVGFPCLASPFLTSASLEVHVRVDAWDSMPSLKALYELYVGGDG